MTASRIVALTGTAALVAAWLSSAAATRDPAIAADTPVELTVASPAPSDFPVVAKQQLERQLERLSTQTGRPPHLRFPARNPFVRATRSSGQSVSEIAGSPPVRSHAGVASESVRAPALSLAGIAVDRTSAGEMQTAILSADGRVLLARTGDIVLERFEVRLVGVDSVELFDRKEDSSLRLTMP
jgi:hypothetical protein